MKFIRPYGSTEILDDDKQRGILPDKKDDNKDFSHQKLDCFFKDKIELHIALWISTIDKIYIKPKNEQVINQDTYNNKHYKYQKNYSKLSDAEFFKNRSELSKKCWDKFCEYLKLQNIEFPLDNKYKEIWNAKTHPYMQNKTINEVDQLYIENKFNKKVTEHQQKQLTWYQVFAKGNPTPQQITDKIYVHIYDKVYLKSGKQQTKNGLYNKRLDAIEKTVFSIGDSKQAIHKVEFDKNNLPTDWQEYSYELPDVIKEIHDSYSKGLNEYKIYSNLKDDKDRKTHRDDKKNTSEYGYLDVAMQALHEHWQEVFGKDATHEQAKTTKPEAYYIHLAVKAYYKKIIKRGDNRLINLVKRLPKNYAEMEIRLGYAKNNSDINHDIRMGKILHYAVGKKWGNDLSALKTDFESSKYHKAQGQHEIKQNEAMVKSWLTVITSASRTLQNWIDPKRELEDFLEDPKKYDLLYNGSKKHINGKTKIHQEFIKKSKIPDLKGEKFYENAFDYDAIKKHANFLFGNLAEAINSEETAKAIILLSLELLYDIRNATFHFKGFDDFINILTSDKKKHDFIKELFENDQKDQSKIILKTLQSLQTEFYLEKDKVQKIVNTLNVLDNDVLLPLPKFSRLLERINNVKDFKSLNFPAPPSHEAFTEHQDLKMQYTILKELYEKPFRSWLHELEWKGFAEKAIKRSNDASIRMNDKSTPEALLRAKTSKINLDECSTISDLFYKLSSESAKEMRVQNGYESNKDTAKEQAEYIEDFKCDIIGQAFAEYLNDNNFKFLLKDKFKRENKLFDLDKDVECKTNSTNYAEQWQKNLYFILHLVPVEEVNQLLHQMRKWLVVTEKSLSNIDKIKADNKTKEEIEKRKSERAKVKAFANILVLYSDMHDYKFIDNEPIPYQDNFKNYYEDGIFDKIFLQQKPTDSNNKDIIPIRGLREILRYGDIEFLNPIFQKQKITKNIYDEYQELDKDIKHAQKEKKDLHKKWVDIKSKKDKSEFVKQNKIAYKGYLNTISTHNARKKSLYLINHKDLHRLLMQVMGRLVGYVHHFERDLYFVTLAKCYQYAVLNKTIPVKYDNPLKDCLGEDGFKYLNNGQANLMFVKEWYDKDNTKYEINSMIEKDIQDYFKLDKSLSIRNNFAHFNMLRKNENFNITNYINKARDLMAYDRKLKNAVAKSIKTIFKKEGIDITFSCDSHDLKNSNVDTQTIYHLGNDKDITEPKHSKEYIEMIEQIMP